MTSFGIFKYMAGYSITQFVSVMILYDIYSNLSDFQFVYIDLFLITTMAALFGFNRAYTGPLAPTPPISALFSILPVFSLLSQLAIAIGVQVRNPKVNLDFTLDRLRSFSTPRVSPGLCHSTTRMPAIRTLHWKGLSTTLASLSKRLRSRFYDYYPSQYSCVVENISQSTSVTGEVMYAQRKRIRWPPWRTSPSLQSPSSSTSSWSSYSLRDLHTESQSSRIGHCS